MFRTIALALTVAGALAVVTAPAQAMTLTISGECRAHCAPTIAPAPGLSFGAIAQFLRATDVPGGSAITVHAVTPAGTVALQPCRPSFSTETFDFPAAYRGNGSYTVVLRRWTTPPGEFMSSCEGSPASEDSISYRITAGASIIAPAEPVLIGRRSDGTRYTYASLTHDAGLNKIEVVYARDPQPAADGSLPGATMLLGPDNMPTIHEIAAKVTEPGRYAAVARPLSTNSFAAGLEPDAPGPWSAPATFTVLQRFDLANGLVVDKTAPEYTIKVAVSPTEARGDRVKAALGVCTTGACTDNTPAFKRFKSLGTVTVGGDGTVTFKKLRLQRGVVSGIRLTHPGSATVAAGSAIQGVRVFQHSGKAKLRTLSRSGVAVSAG